MEKIDPNKYARKNLGVEEWTKLRDDVQKGFIYITFCQASEWFLVSWKDNEFKTEIQYHATKFRAQSDKYKGAAIGSVYLFKTPYMFDKAIRVDFCNYMIDQYNKEKPTFKSKLIELCKKYFY